MPQDMPPVGGYEAVQYKVGSSLCFSCSSYRGGAEEVGWLVSGRWWVGLEVRCEMETGGGLAGRGRIE